VAPAIDRIDATINAGPKFARLYGRPMPFQFEEDSADYRSRFEP
jgi:hypothetical protein